MENTQPQYTFTFYRFTTNDGKAKVGMVRDAANADGMRALISKTQLEDVTDRVTSWATEKGISITAQPLYPSTKYPGKMWIDFRFGGLTL